jgi:outer membrane protein OmpA-like peptidoglycan-associated protein
MFSRFLFLVFAVMILAESVPADAQVIRSNQSLYARIGAGTSVSETDASTYAVEPYSLSGEIGYQWTRSLGFGLGLTHADYPKATDVNTRMTTVQALTRWTLFPDQPVTPYFNVGPHLTFGGDNLAGGALFGLGVDYVLTRRTSVFLDATAYATFPDDAIDSRDDGRATFDGLGFWGAGIRSSLNAAPAPVELYPIEGPLRVYRGEPVRFTVRATDESSLPIKYAWELGDGTKTDGLVVEHTYRLEGDYTMSVRAENAAGHDTQMLRITVEERPVAPTILSMSADTVRAYTHQLIRFAAYLEGSAPLDAVWTFGDGTPEVVERAAHAYDRDRYIGQMASDVRQGYVFEKPGEYQVVLSAQNRFGTDEATVIVQVEPQMQFANAVVPVDPCYKQTAIDTVYFDFDRATLDMESYARLETAAKRLKQCPNQLVRIDGYADWVGARDYNATLSYRRAEEVQRVYASHGVDQDRIVIRGQGELDPPCADASLNGPGEKGCRSFRRVESLVVMDEAPLASTPAAPVLQEAALQPAHAVPAQAERGIWVLSVGWYASLSDAHAAAESARSRYGSKLNASNAHGGDDRSADASVDLHVVEADTDEPGFRVVIGPLSSRSEAQAHKLRLASDIPVDTWLYKLDRPLPTRVVNR